MIDKTEAQPEALAVAEILEQHSKTFGEHPSGSKARGAAELRRQHPEIQHLKAQLSAQLTVPHGFVSLYESNARGIFAKTPTMMHDGPEHKWRPVAFIDAETDALVPAPPPPEREPLTDEQIDAALIAWFGSDLVNSEQVYRDTMRDAINAAQGIGAPNETH